MHKIAAATSEADGGFFTCPTCHRMFTQITAINPTGLLEDDMTVSPGGNSSQGSLTDRNGGQRGNGKCRDAMGFEPKFKHSTWVSRSDYDEKLPLVPSAKTAVLKGILLKGFQEAPMDKVS